MAAAAAPAALPTMPCAERAGVSPAPPATSPRRAGECSRARSALSATARNPEPEVGTSLGLSPLTQQDPRKLRS